MTERSYLEEAEGAVRRAWMDPGLHNEHDRLRAAVEAAAPFIRADERSKLRETLLSDETIQDLKRSVNNRWSGIWPPPRYQGSTFLRTVLALALSNTEHSGGNDG